MKQREADTSAGKSGIEREAMFAYDEVLVPTLGIGDIVFLVNPSCNKVAGISEAVNAVCASLRFLPSYSPDFTPIEQLFSKLGSLLRKAASRKREQL